MEMGALGTAGARGFVSSNLGLCGEEDRGL